MEYRGKNTCALRDKSTGGCKNSVKLKRIQCYSLLFLESVDF